MADAPTPGTASDSPSPPDEIAHIYRELLRIRRVEEEVARIYPTDKIQSPVHLSIGQEAVSVGVCQALRSADVVFGTYRGHALYLAKGGSLRRMIAELYGRSTGCCGGKGGSMHLIDVAAGVMGMSAVVATTLPNAVGYALAARLRGTGQVVASFFGDGAVEEGVFSESLNFAALHRLPIVFVCENNGYAIHTRITDRQAGPGIVARAESLGVPAKRVSGDVFAIAAIARDLVTSVRTGSGPRLIECPTYRLRAHVGPEEDFDLGYRTRAEAEPWQRADAVAAVAALLEDSMRADLNSQVEQEVSAAFAFAEASPFPEPSQLHTDVFSGA